MVALDGTACLPRETIGNKGFGIDTMRSLRLPVPPAFCITREVCEQFFADPAAGIGCIWDDVVQNIRWLERETSRTFGRGSEPLLVSVRSGAAQSMPGMLDTVLNLGINDAVEQALARSRGPEFARDVRARFENSYRRIVLGGNEREAALATHSHSCVERSKRCSRRGTLHVPLPTAAITAWTLYPVPRL
ncbi:pyruvate phosphate dikinase, PEP/pyruvate binding domain protein [Mycobacterium xenopi 4042]|uniref:Pyruvate phosphate dikinase, PEP/pyruvate binding domain protein n=1 Tax=Mycobacterium xenopi 4042 TaxID=1299334 RepID=X8AHR1_MYCXE|nr:pyruvate phosphate dikinase, PEP/pyruvate binding domain protein [Mycobacterium xenopi 4042]